MQHQTQHDHDSWGTVHEGGASLNGQQAAADGEEVSLPQNGGAPGSFAVSPHEPHGAALAAATAPAASVGTFEMHSSPYTTVTASSPQNRSPEQKGQQKKGQHQQQGEEEQEQQQGVKRRRICEGCERPASVCYCEIVKGRELHLSDPEVSGLIDRIIVFMHPLEKKRKSGSIRVLQRLVRGLEVWAHRRPGCCPFAAEQQQLQQEHETRHNAIGQSAATVRIPREGQDSTPDTAAAAAAGRREGQEAAGTAVPRAPDPTDGGLQQHQRQHLCTREGAALVDTSNMLLLFPTEKSFPLTVGALPVRLPVTLLVIDGTWKEAKEMFSAAPWLQQLPAVHLPIRSDALPSSSTQEEKADVSSSAAAPASATAADANPAINSHGTSSALDALRVSGVYGLIRTPPARIAASGGVCTAEAIAETLAVLGRWGRSTCSSLLQISEATKETLQHIVSQQQNCQMRGKKGSED